MAWYSKYLGVFEKSFDGIHNSLVEMIRYKVDKLQSSDPKVSIVIIAHNESHRLLSCIWSLVDNEYNFPIEIIGVDNCSTDNTADVFKSLGIRYLYEERPGPGYARQCGLDNARGNYYVCIDADSIYPPKYVKTMVAELTKPNVVAAYSLWSFVPDEKNSRIALTTYEFVRDLHLMMQSINRPELSVRGMVFAFNAKLGRQIGFRTDIRRGEDGSMLLELKKLGKVTMILNPKARIFTSNATLNLDGSLFSSLSKRIGKAFKDLSSYVTKETKYVDEESNML